MRESAELYRLSPITQIRPFGTVIEKSSPDTRFTSAGSRTYGSSTACPFTDSRPWASQHCTRSPGSPMTRLMRSSPCPGPSHAFGSRKTTTSPRSSGITCGTSSLTSTRSPTSRVFSIDSDGM